MSRKRYVLSFIVLSVVFVPVVLDFGIVIYAVPTAYIAVVAGSFILHGNFACLLWVFGHLSVYLLLFYTAARITFRLSLCSPSTRAHRIIQYLVLLFLFSSSFIRALTYSSIQGSGGSYTFWGAASRYLDKHQSR